MTADIWRHLGIPETQDEGEVRRAYAERLKSTNPEDDPEGFKRLRSAYERALQQIRWRVRYEAVDEEDDWDDLDVEDGAPPRLPPPPDRPPESPPEPDPELDAHNALRKRLEQAVAAQSSPWEIQAAFQALVANPAMERLPIYAATEAWVANLIRNYGGGGPLIEIAISHFKWGDRSRLGDLGASMQAFRETLAEEDSSRAFVARVRDRRHEFNVAFKETSRPLKDRNWLSRLLSFPRIDIVRRFLDYVDDKVPYAYDELDYAAADWWRRRINFWLTPLNIISRILPIAVIAGIIALFAIYAPGQPARVELDRILARDACAESVESGDASACDAYLELAPDSLLMRQYAGIIALREGRLAEARTHFQIIAALSPLDPVARYGHGLALSRGGDPAEQAQGTALMRQALALDETVSTHFAQYGVPSATVLDPAESVPTFPDPTGPQYDTPPGDIRLDNRSTVFRDAYTHFGIAEDFEDGRVRVQCFVRAAGNLANCQIIEETPLNRGRGEMALRILRSGNATPGRLNGEAVDGAPIRVPVRFEMGE